MMRNQPLLRVETSYCTFHLFGPYMPTKGLLRVDASSKAYLAIKSSIGVAEAYWSDFNGIIHKKTVENVGPSLFEDTTYRVRVKSRKVGQLPILNHRDPYIIKDIDNYTDENMCAGTINFKRQVGHSTFEISVGHETLTITIEVLPVKIDYQSDYKSLLSEVSLAARGLALEYLRATFRSGGVEEAESVTNLEWLTLLRNEIDLICRSIDYINNHPMRLLSSDTFYVRVDKIKRVDSSLRNAIMRGSGLGNHIAVPGIGKVREKVLGRQSKETLNTLEHRWLKQNLSMICYKLEELHETLDSEERRYISTSRKVPDRLLFEKKEVASFIQRVSELLSLEIFKALSGDVPSGFSSLTLLGAPGYSEAYRTILTLRMGLSIDGNIFDLSVKDLHELYEVWCFIKIANIVSGLVKGVSDCSDMLSVNSTGIRVKLTTGSCSQIKFTCTNPNRIVTITYNQCYPGLTGDQRPDIVIKIKDIDWPELVIVFDAKYRLDASDEYRRRYRVVGPPQDAINAIHRYRDAIVLNNEERGLERPVVKGAALFPLPLYESINYKNSPLFDALGKLGIGALPFLPDNTELVKDWLSQLLSLSSTLLSDPGPPFSGLYELNKRLAAQVI